MKKKSIIWLPLVVYAGIIFYISSLPGSSLKSMPAFPMADKLGHVLAYTIFGLLVARAASMQYPGIEISRLSIWIILGTAFYGATDEFHQSFVVSRSCAFSDWLADLLGGIMACGIWHLYAGYRKLNILPEGDGV